MPTYVIWFLIGLGFLATEMALPGFIVIFFGLGAMVTALVLVVADIGLTAQIVIFIVSSLASLFFLRKYALRTFSGHTGDKMEVEDFQFEAMGKTAEVVKAIRADRPGKIKFRGSFWKASADQDVAKGQMVVIVDAMPAEAVKFKVKPVDNGDIK